MATFFVRLRWPLLGVAFALAIYFAVFVLFLCVNMGFYRQATPARTWGVYFVQVGSYAARAGIVPGDEILAVDGWPVSSESDWHVPALVFQPEHTYTVKSGGVVRDVVLPNEPLDFDTLRTRGVPFLLVFAFLIAGAVVLFYAPISTALPWRIGVTFLAGGVGVAALSGGIFGVPGGRTASEILLPIAAIGLVEISIPDGMQLEKWQHNALLCLKFCGVYFAVNALVEIFVREGTRVVFPETGYVNLHGIYLYIAGCVALVLALVWGRYWRSSENQLLRVLSVFLGLSFLPFLVLVAIPVGVFRTNIFWPWGYELSLLALALFLPAGYAYLVYRPQYAVLDVAYPRAVSDALLAFMGVGGYQLFIAYAGRYPVISAHLPEFSSLYWGAVVVGAFGVRHWFMTLVCALLAVRGDAVQHLHRVMDLEQRSLSARIHDGPLQAFAFGAVYADLIVSDYPGAAEKAEKVIRILGEGGAELRLICAGLRPQLDQNLVEVLELAVRDSRLGAAESVDLELDFSGVSDEFPPGFYAARVFYQVARQAFDNIVSHAKASYVWVELQREKRHVVLRVSDNGVGLPPNLDFNKLERGRHFGLVGMREWAGTVGGRVDFSPREGGGTVITLSVPDIF